MDFTQRRTISRINRCTFNSIMLIVRNNSINACRTIMCTKRPNMSNVLMLASEGTLLMPKEPDFSWKVKKQ